MPQERMDKLQETRSHLLATRAASKFMGGFLKSRNTGSAAEGEHPGSAGGDSPPKREQTRSAGAAAGVVAALLSRQVDAEEAIGGAAMAGSPGGATAEEGGGAPKPSRKISFGGVVGAAPGSSNPRGADYGADELAA